MEWVCCYLLNKWASLRYLPPYQSSLQTTIPASKPIISTELSNQTPTLDAFIDSPKKINL